MAEVEQQSSSGPSSMDVAEEILASASKAINLGFTPRIVLPGDSVTQDVSHAQRVTIGKFNQSEAYKRASFQRLYESAGAHATENILGQQNT